MSDTMTPEVEAVARAIEKARLYSKSPEIWARDAIAAMREHEKPTWEDAPEWARYRTIDHNGDIWWWKEKPELEEAGGIWVAPDGATFGGQRANVSKVANWQSTLEQRGEQEKPCSHENLRPWHDFSEKCVDCREVVKKHGKWIVDREQREGG